MTHRQLYEFAKFLTVAFARDVRLPLFEQSGPGTIGLDPEQFLVHLERRHAEGGPLVDLARHRYPVADQEVLQLRDDVLRAR